MARAPEELEVLEGDEGEPEVGRHHDVGREILATALSEVKRDPAVVVAPTATVARAVELMRRRRATAVLVVERRSRGPRVAGIFTERDLVDRALPARRWASAPVRRFMTPNPETLRARDPVAYALEKMSVGRFRHVPIVDDGGKPEGVVSIRDLVDFLVELCPEEILNLPPEPELALHPRAEGD